MGKRLGELTRENTKCMVKVHEQTLIERMIGQLERLALRRIIIVIGYKGEKVRDLLGNKIHNTPIIYISNPIYDKTNNIYSLYLAKEFLVEDETILLESDLIFADSILPSSASFLILSRLFLYMPKSMTPSLSIGAVTATRLLPANLSSVETS